MRIKGPKLRLSTLVSSTVWVHKDWHEKRIVKTKEAKEFIEKYFASYPKIKNYIDSSINFAKETQYSMTLSGRKRPLRDINVASGLQLSNLQNMAVNSPVQGTASDLIKLAIVKFKTTYRRLDYD